MTRMTTEVIPKGARELCTPTDGEAKRLDEIVEKVVARTKLAAAKFPETRGVVLGGSFAKGTWLPGEADIDIFVKFSSEVDEERFEEVGLKVGFEATKGYPRGKKYAQHPYTEASVDEVVVNIVPCYDVQPGQWKSAADRSPFHVELIRTKLSDPQKLDVRLLKKFMKGVGVYGAEIEKEGFSGYACEVLVLRNGTFSEVLKHFAHLKAAAPEKLLSLLDPVDERRDLAKAISDENVARLVLAARVYLKRPTLQFFLGKRGMRHTNLKGQIIGISFTHAESSEDIMWGELKRTMKHLSGHITRAGFALARTAIASDNRRESAFLILPEVRELSPSEKRIGPSVVMEREATEFLAKNSKKARLVWVGEEGKLQILKDRDETRLLDFLKRSLRGGVSKMGGSPTIGRAIAKSGRVVEGRALQRAAKRKEWLSAGLDDIVSDTLGTSPD
jgi:tRNA nucleotidyltransferase (CCA-adding enzyme)